MNTWLAHIGLVAALGLLGTPPVSAKENSGTTSTRRAKAPRTPANPVHGETSKERSQRLARECRGKPNAGACEGFAN